jgi:hypothetical protein
MSRNVKTSAVAAHARNADLRADAERAADVVIGEADQRAAKVVDARIARQPEPEQVPQLARALLPSAATKAKEAAAMDTTLDFLNPPPTPRPPDAPLDDAALSLQTASNAGSPSEPATGDEDDAARRLQHEQHAARLEMQTEIRKLSVKELLDLRKPNVPDLVLMAAMFERLFSLMLRLFSLGFYKHGGAINNALAARQQLAELAEEELTRRRKSPATAQGKKDALREYQEALQQRSSELDRRQDNRKQAENAAGLPSLVAARKAERTDSLKQGERIFDTQQVEAGKQTIAARRAALADAQAALERERADDFVPTPSGLFVTKQVRDAALVANAARAARMARAKVLRDQAREELQQFLDVIEASVHKVEQQKLEREAAAEANEKKERDALARELGALPEQLVVLAAEAQNAHHAQRGAVMVAEAARPRTQQELEAEAAEAERLRLLRMRG